MNRSEKSRFNILAIQNWVVWIQATRYVYLKNQRTIALLFSLFDLLKPWLDIIIVVESFKLINLEYMNNKFVLFQSTFYSH